MTIPFPKEHLTLGTLIVDQGVTLTGDGCNFGVENKLIVKGAIAGTGKIHVHGRPEGEERIDASGGIELLLNMVDMGKLGDYFTSPLYPRACYFYQEPAVVTLDRDLTIPEGKSVLLNRRCTLKVNQGVTLRIEGRLDTYNPPMIEGMVIGEITMLN
jgi:hypothetical protein